jgi:hypothetical protein
MPGLLWLVAAMILSSTTAICQINASENREPNPARTSDPSYVAGCRPITEGPLKKVFSFHPWTTGVIENLTREPALQACKAIGDYGTCLAAAHARQNLGIKFDCLRADMIGSAPQLDSQCPAGTGSKKMKLQQSIGHLRPGIDAKAAVKIAKSQAGREICLL